MRQNLPAYIKYKEFFICILTEKKYLFFIYSKLSDMLKFII